MCDRGVVSRHDCSEFFDEHIFWLLKLASSDEKLNKLEPGTAVRGTVARTAAPDTARSRWRRGSSNTQLDWRDRSRRSTGMEFPWRPPCSAEMRSKCTRPTWRSTGTRRKSRRTRCHYRRRLVGLPTLTTACWCSRIRWSRWRSRKRRTRDRLETSNSESQTKRRRAVLLISHLAHNAFSTWPTTFVRRSIRQRWSRWKQRIQRFRPIRHTSRRFRCHWWCRSPFRYFRLSCMR